MNPNLKSALLSLFLAAQAFAPASVASGLNVPAAQPIEIENQYVKFVIGADGSNAAFIDQRSGRDYCDHRAGGRFARMKLGGKEFAVTQAACANGKISAQFGDSGVTVLIAVALEKRYFTLETLSVSGPAVDELVFLDVPLTCQGSPADEFQCCALALNIQTDIDDLPGPSRRLRAAAYSRPGLVGAKAAVLACPPQELRNVMKEAVRASPDLPQTDRGGPWALDAEANRGSYLIDYPGSISEKNVDQWLAAARGIGARQIDFHTGHTLRFGDYAPDPTLYPRGLASVKAVIDQLHAAGIAAGLHTYAFFLAKDSHWVTPAPDPRLGKDATFTLTSALSETGEKVTVAEPTREMSAVTGFQVRNSVTLQIDDELITYAGLDQAPPYAFTGCRRGACGTKPAPHQTGAKVRHLKECFGLFTPDGDSTLFEEVAARTAEVYNHCGFDMIYLDALDGADILGRWPYAPKYYSARFVYSLCRALRRPAIMEMSAFDHHLWFARSRLGAWDAPSKGYRPFIDQHFLDNQTRRPALLPANLGWWCLFDWTPKDRIRTFPEDLEYLMCKAIAGDYSLSWLMGFEPQTFQKSFNARRLGALVKQYEDLRLENYFSPSVRRQLSAPNSEFTLEQPAQGRWQFRPVRHDLHKVSGSDVAGNRWQVQNPFARQPLQVRIEALLSLSPYDRGGEALATFDSPAEFGAAQSSVGVTGALLPVSTPVKAGAQSGCFSAKRGRNPAPCAWTMVEKKFSKPVTLLERGFGVWVCGDGQGEVLNFQWRAPERLSSGLSEHYAVIDFTGWRYFEFVEPESARLMDYAWPYFYPDPDRDFAGPQAIQRWNRVTATYWVDYANLDSLKLWYTRLPQGEGAKCYLSPIKALAHMKTRLVDPSITVGGHTLTFPATLESGGYLEFRSQEDCKVYDAQGALVGQITPQGDVPELEAGTNAVRFTCRVAGQRCPRANVTIIAQDPNPVGQ